MSAINDITPEEWDSVREEWDRFKAQERHLELSGDAPPYLTRDQLAQALKDSLAREEELKGQVYSLEQVLDGIQNNIQSAYFGL